MKQIMGWKAKTTVVRDGFPGFEIIDDYSKPRRKPTQKEVDALIDLIKKSGGKMAVVTTPLRKNED